MRFEILSITIGSAQPFRDDAASAIAKQPTEGPVAVRGEGLAGDEQADRIHHGGPDMAIHHYPRDHYDFWREHLCGHPLLESPGALGENIATHGLAESAACIGDRFRLGTALVEISQGRKPCWKIDHRFGRPGMSTEVVRTRRSGWYYRVLEDGFVQAGDALELVERRFAEWTVARVFGLLVAGGHRSDRASLRALAELAPLSVVWRERAAQLIG